MMRALLATTNLGKLAEYRRILADPRSGVGLDLIAIGDWPAPIPEVVEDGATFEANAIKKAVSGAIAAAACALAEDSGLEVDALGGEPGIHSARFAGAHGDDKANNHLLAERTRALGPEERGARYVAAVALAAPLGAPGPGLGTALLEGPPAEPGRWGKTSECRVAWWRASWEGSIAREPRGSGGFGYDPYFVPRGSDRSAAEMSAAEKDRISHRARALRLLARALEGRP